VVSSGPTYFRRQAILKLTKCGAVHCGAITCEPANLLNDHETTEINYNWSQLYLATQLIPFDGTAQDLTHVLACVLSLDLLKEELFGLQ
jgi:hypothetical protein